MTDIRQGDTSHLSVTSIGTKKTVKRDTISRGGAGSSSVSLLAPYRGSIAFKTGKGGFKVPRYQNTYQLESSNPFKARVVDKILESVIQNSVTKVKQYDPKVCMKHCQDMAIEIRNQIYKRDFARYKYIVTVTAIEKLGQGNHVSIGCIWDAQKDNYSTYVFENLHFYVIAIVAAVYYN